MRKNLKKSKRIIIKVGTSSLIHENGNINLKVIDELAFTLSALQNQGKEIILVSSGAIGVGLHKLGLQKRPNDIVKQQAIAAIGQAELINIYKQRFATYLQPIAQILLTRDVIDFPKSKINAQNSINELLKMKIIPIINENDAVSIDELGHETKFGDNDELSSIIAILLNADLLIMLSDINGFYSANPNTNLDAKLFSYINEVNDELYELAKEKGSKFGSGGMISKLNAAKRVLQNNSAMLLTNGQNPKIIFDILQAKELGTLFINKDENAK